jgi:hypothetical protein
MQADFAAAWSAALTPTAGRRSRRARQRYDAALSDAGASPQFWIGLILRCRVQKSTPDDYDRVAGAPTYAFQNDTAQQLSGDPYQ